MADKSKIEIQLQATLMLHQALLENLLRAECGHYPDPLAKLRQDHLILKQHIGSQAATSPDDKAHVTQVQAQAIADLDALIDRVETKIRTAMVTGSWRTP